MKKWMKTAAAAFIGAAICTAAGSLSASADVTPDGDTLKLSGNVTVDEVQAYANNEAVKKVVCEPGTVFPADSSNLFYQFMYAESIDLSNADTSQVTDMENLFAWCHELTSLKISNFKTNNVTNMSGMFALCHKLKKLDLSNFNTEKVKSMASMFDNCKLLESVDLSSFKTSELENTAYMFNNCVKINELDLCGFDMSNANDVRAMFGSCSGLKTIYVLDNWNLDANADDTAMFLDCRELVGGKGTKHNNGHTDKEYACIDGMNGKPGYFTYSENYVKGASLSLDGTITVNFYIKPSSKAAKVTVKSLNDPNETFEFDLKEENSYYKQADGSFKIPAQANAAQAGVKFTLKVLDAAGNPLDIYNSDYEKLANRTVSYSVNDYIADTAQYSDNALVKDLVQKLDTYCKAAENYFCGTSHALDIPVVNITKTNNFNKQFKISLVLDSTTELRIYSDASQCQVPFGTEYASLLCEQNSKGRYFRRFVPAHKLLNDDTIILDGVSYKVNPMDYCALVFAKDGGDPNLTAVCAALYHYGAAAKAYAESIQN